MKRLQNILAIGLLAAFFSQSAFAAPDAPVAKVNGVPIPASRSQLLVDDQISRGAPDTPQLREAIKKQLVDLEILSQAANKKNLAKKPEIATQIDLAKQGILARAYIDDFVKSHPISEAEYETEYNKIKADMGDKEYKPRHVLVDTEDEAIAIITKLKAGEKFEELAKVSKDPGTKDKGGELGWSNPKMFVKPFSDAMVKLKKGTYTQTPVKSDFGYHVIMLDDTRNIDHPPLSEVKPQIEQRLQQQRIEKQIDELREKAKIE